MFKEGKKNNFLFRIQPKRAGACRLFQRMVIIKSKFKKGIIPLADGVYYFYV